MKICKHFSSSNNNHWDCDCDGEEAINISLNFPQQVTTEVLCAQYSGREEQHQAGLQQILTGPEHVSHWNCCIGVEIVGRSESR